MPATSIAECNRFAQSVTAAGGELPDPLRHLLSGWEVLTLPVATQAPETAIVDACLDGSLTAAKLNKLLPAAAQAQQVDEYRGSFVRSKEHTLVGAFRQPVDDGGADGILDSLRPAFDRHADGIAEAKSLFTSESSPDFVLESGEDATIRAWNQLGPHAKAIARIAAVAAMFGTKSSALFPQIREFPLGENFKIHDYAVMCTAGPLVVDSGLFMAPYGDHRTSAYFRAGGLKLHSVSEAQARYAMFAADEHDRIHGGQLGGYINEDGRMIEDTRPLNPYRQEVEV